MKICVFVLVLDSGGGGGGGDREMEMKVVDLEGINAIYSFDLLVRVAKP